MAVPLIYLAGPDVFRPEPERWAERKKAICARHGLAGVSPLDVLAGEPAEWACLPEWQRIARKNEALIRGADAMIANLTPFRGPSADPGTVYEMGLMRALCRPVFGYATTALPFTHRTLDFVGASRAVAGPDRVWRDAEDMLIEQFGLFENLMIEAAIVDSGGALVVEEVAATDRWSDLAVFERCVRRAAAQLTSPPA